MNQPTNPPTHQLSIPSHPPPVHRAGRGRGAGDPRRLATPGGLDQLGGWFWESGYDKSSIDDFELIRDLNFRSMYGAWDALKNVDKVYPS